MPGHKILASLVGWMSFNLLFAAQLNGVHC